MLSRVETALTVADREGRVAEELGTIIVDLLTVADPAEIMERLAHLAMQRARGDRCTIASIAERVRVEASVARDGQPDFVGTTYPLSSLADQPALKRAIDTGDIVLAGSFLEQGRTELALAVAPRGVKRSAIVPLKLGDDISALLILSRRDDQPFERPDLEWLQTVGGIAVLARRNARLLGEVSASQHRGLDALTQISQHVASSDTLPGFFGRMSKTVATLARAQRAAFWMIEHDHLVAQHEAHGFPPDVIAQMRPALQSVVDRGLGSLLYAGQAFRYRVAPDREAASVPLPIAPGDVRDVLAVPWRTAEGMLGMLVAYDSIAGFTAQDEWIMRLAARTSAIVWQGYRAEQRANELQAQDVARLELHAQRMASLERQKSDFLKLASHELRGPLAVIGGYLSMLADGTMGDLPVPVGSIVPKMVRRLDQMKEMVDEMISAARVEEGRLPLSLDDTRIDELVRAVVAALDLPGATLPAIIVDAPAEAHAFADPRHVETIVTNLLSNALKYSPPSQPVTLRVRERDQVVELDVTDYGSGIDQADVNGLFQPFGRLEDGASSGVEGTGLGLYLSRQLARLQGGDVTVRSKVGEGSVFTLSLPRRADQERAQRPELMIAKGESNG